MKVRTYIRVGHNKKGTGAGRKPRVHASMKPSDEPLYDSRNYAIPTVAFAVDLDLPDALFERAETVLAELKISESSAQVAATVKRVPN